MANLPRVQFPIRALFAFTLLAAVIAGIARGVIGLEDVWLIVGSATIGIAVGFATVLIVQHVNQTWLLITLLFGFVAMNGFWIPSYLLLYVGGVIIGAILGWKGLFLINAVFFWCGITIASERSAISRERRPSRVETHDPEGD